MNNEAKSGSKEYRQLPTVHKSEEGTIIAPSDLKGWREIERHKDVKFTERGHINTETGEYYTTTLVERCTQITYKKRTVDGKEQRIEFDMHPTGTSDSRTRNH